VQQGFRAIAVSRFGYLRTPMPPDASPAAQADAHACLLDALGLERVAVIGASAGAPSTLEFAIRHPERVSHLVLLVPAVFMPRADGAGAEVPPGLELIFATALRWDFPYWAASRVARRSLIRTMLATPPDLLDGVSDGERARVDAMVDSVLPVSARRAGLLNDGRTTSHSKPSGLRHIRAPTLVVSAADDSFGTFERGRYTAAEIDGARFAGFADGGHLLVGRQAEVSALLAQFLADPG
jgi:pimeloyl-ACP methyl ester carboxylesterase